MKFLNLALALPALMTLSSAMILQRPEVPMLFGTPSPSSFVSATAACEKEDEEDCKEFCKLSEQTYKCSAAGNKITCSCKGGKSESNCEERCLLCMPDKSSLEEASRLFKL